MEHFLCSPEMKPFSIVSEMNVCFSVKLKRLFVLNLKIVNLKKKIVEKDQSKWRNAIQFYFYFSIILKSAFRKTQSW